MTDEHGRGYPPPPADTRVAGMPPTPLPGPSAQALFTRVILAFGAAIGAGLLASSLLRMAPLPQGVPALVLGPLSLLALWAILRMLGPVGDRLVAELSRGYTSLRMPFGGFTTNRGRRNWLIGFRTPWDFDTVWVLDRRGKVIRPPRRPGAAPGFHSSPTRPGAQELWTGRVWAGVYR
jgi:hypothetical protein